LLAPLYLHGDDMTNVGNHYPAKETSVSIFFYVFELYHSLYAFAFAADYGLSRN
jgi:hypothetical protein